MQDNTHHEPAEEHQAHEFISVDDPPGCNQYRICRVAGHPFLEHGDIYLTKRTDFELFIDVCVEDDLVIRVPKAYFMAPSERYAPGWRLRFRMTGRWFGVSSYRFNQNSRPSREWFLGSIHLILIQP